MTVTINGTTGIAGVDGTAATPAIQGNDTNTGIFFPAADTIAFAEGGAEVARFDSSGNFGIGTNSPSSYAKLAVRGYVTTGSYNYSGLFSDAVNSSLYIGHNAATATLLSDAAIAFATGSPASLTERMRLTSSGNLLINSTTSPAGNGNIFINGGLYVGTTNTDPTFNRLNGMNLLPGGTIYARANGSWDLGRDATSGTHISFYTDNGSSRVSAGYISSNGSTTTYGTSSDYRMKENIAPMTGALAKVQSLKPITYDWKDEFVGTKKSAQGFIAHELAEVVPDCVVGEKDAVDADGNPKYQGIDTSFLVATLTAAIQEQQAIITDLKSRIEALEQA